MDRIRELLDRVKARDHRLNDLEKVPTGDDYNAQVVDVIATLEAVLDEHQGGE